MNRPTYTMTLPLAKAVSPPVEAWIKLNNFHISLCSVSIWANDIIWNCASIYTLHNCLRHWTNTPLWKKTTKFYSMSNEVVSVLFIQFQRIWIEEFHREIKSHLIQRSECWLMVEIGAKWYILSTQPDYLLFENIHVRLLSLIT